MVTRRTRGRSLDRLPKEPQGGPKDWDEEASLREWFPDEAVREQVRALAIEAADAAPARQKAIWKRMARHFPPALAALIGETPWRWGNTVSPKVAAVALDLMRTASRSSDPGEIDAITKTLERILPDAPLAALLDEVAGSDVFREAVDAVRTARTRAELAHAEPMANALNGLLYYLVEL